MPRDIKITLGSPIGLGLGPNFNLTANVGSVTPSTATRTQLLAGRYVVVDDNASFVTITSVGDCTNAIIGNIPCAPTTTTSTSTTTTSTSTTTAPTTTTSTSTTSTSTTTAPTTTTSTSTSTTTTTTLAPCYEGVVVQVTNGDALNWETCAGISDGGAYPVGQHTLPGCIKPETIVGDGETTFEIVEYGAPCTTTTTSTTSTSTTSTSTTSTSTSSTTTTTLAPCYQNTTVQVTNGDALNWLTCDGISDGGFYPVGEHTLPGCIKPETIVGDGETTFVIITIGTPCTTTTTQPTTTSTSTSTTTTTTVAPPDCVTSVNFEVDTAGTVVYLTCCGDPIVNFYGIGPQVINDCMQNGSLFGDGATISFVTYGSTACSCVTTTTSTSTSTTTAPTTTTTTTTVAPGGLCYSYTDDPANVPSNLNVRYRAISTGNITTTPIDQLEARDNNDGTYTWYICVQQGSSYAIPVCVIGINEVTCPQAWIEGGSCTFNGECDVVPSQCLSYNIQGSGLAEYEDCDGNPLSFFCETYCSFNVCSNGVINLSGTLTASIIGDCSTTTTTTAATTTTTTAATTTTTTAAPTSTTTTTSGGVSATNVFGYMEPCIGGTIDDHMGAAVFLNAPVSVDTVFDVQVSYVFPGSSCSSFNNTQFFSILIEAGQASSNFIACNQGAYFPSGAQICSACINFCDNPAVNISAVSC